jgi:hypothetical protein
VNLVITLNIFLMKIFVRYKIDEGIAEHVYKNLHLPHHCSFIPTKLVWPQAKTDYKQYHWQKLIWNGSCEKEMGGITGTGLLCLFLFTDYKAKT